MNSPLASLPNLNVNITEMPLDKEVTLPAIGSQPKHSSQLDLAREVKSSMTNSRYGGSSYNRNNHYTVAAVTTTAHKRASGGSMDVKDGPA